MIEKLSSQELNNIFEKAKNDTENIKKQIKDIKLDLETKLRVMQYETEYINYRYEKLNKGGITLDHMTTLSQIKTNTCTSYGNCVHAKLAKSPINVFNLTLSTLGESYFRDDVKVTIDGVEKKEYNTILMQDSNEDKCIYFELKDKDRITLTIALKDTDALLGATRSNCIEIDPYLPGSFNIETIKIFGFKEDGTINNEETPYIISKINNVSKTRLILDKKISFYKVMFDIKINFSVNKDNKLYYPFGLKHIYFYDMDFNDDSYIIATVKTDSYIDYIKDQVILKTPYGEDNTQTCSLLDIELYAYNDNGQLSYKIEPSVSSDIHQLALNVNTFYAKIPIKRNNDFIGITFYPVTRVN